MSKTNLSRSDEELRRRLRLGEQAALGAFMQRHRGALLAFIERNLGTNLRRKVEPDDIFQEVSVHCVRSLGQVDLAERDPFAWLCQVAERRIVDAHRRFFGTQKRAGAKELPLGAPDTQHAGLIDLLVASLTSPSEAFSRDQRQIRVIEAIRGLPADHREALRLRYVEGLPSKEVAARLGKSDGAIRVMLTRTLKKLGDLLSDPETTES